MRNTCSLVGLAFLLLTASCNRDPRQLAQVFESIEDGKWNWNQKVVHNFEVAKAGKKVQVTLQLRHGNDYPYENLYLMLRLKQPNEQVQRLRVSLQLADDNGQWLGKTSGGAITFRTKLAPVWRLPAAGQYSLEIEQNMRDNPLLGVEDIGFEARLID